MSTRGLRDDIEALQAVIREQEAAQAVNRVELDQARAGLLEQRFEIEAQKARLARLLRMTFGRSSEKLRMQLEQLELTLTDLDESLAATLPPDDQTGEPAELSRKPARRPLPAHLPRDIIEHPAPCACPTCGGALRPLVEDVTEILDYVPASFRVIRHVRPKFSFPACKTIVQAPAPSLPVRRGRAETELLAHVPAAKYPDHLPLHRQAEIYAREDVDLCRSTLADIPVRPRA